jgi:hypothetical protein
MFWRFWRVVETSEVVSESCRFSVGKAARRFGTWSERRSMVRKNIGWKPMLHCFQNCPSDLQEPGSGRCAPRVTTR